MRSTTCRASWPDLAGIAAAELTAQLPSHPAAPGTRLWLVTWDPDAGPTVLDRWAAALQPRDRVRLAAVGAPGGRARFSASHAALTRLAAQEPARFWSLSHARSCAAIAAASEPVGVDLEPDAPRRHWRAAARTLWPADPPVAWSQFLRAWVIAEASIKAGPATRPPAVLIRVSVAGRGEHLLALVWAHPGSAAGACPGSAAVREHLAQAQPTARDHQGPAIHV